MGRTDRPDDGLAGSEAPIGRHRAARASPWRRAGRQLLHDRAALISTAALVVVVVLCLAAPLYAKYVAHTNPFVDNLNGTTVVGGRHVSVVQQSPTGIGEVPIGPTWTLRHYFLGADSQGRDVAARLLYGGRTSLLVATISAAATCLLATVLALVSGFFGGIVDAVLSRFMDLLWAFPVYLLAILIATVSLSQPLRIGPLAVSSSSVALPIVIISVIFVPYVFRPVRGQVLAVAQKDYVKAARLLGAPDRWLLRSEVLPNVLRSVVVFVPLMIALTMLTESALSFLGLGVQPPAASWGSILGTGQQLLYTRPVVSIAPGVMISVVVVALNVLGDRLRDALDPKASLRPQA